MIKSLLLKFMTLIIRHFSADKEITLNIVISKKITQQIKAIVEYIENNYNTPITLADLANIGQFSIPYLCITFKSLAGIPPMDYIIRKRISEAKIA